MGQEVVRGLGLDLFVGQRRAAQVSVGGGGGAPKTAILQSKVCTSRMSA